MLDFSQKIEGIPGVEILSMGKSLEVIKDLGNALIKSHSSIEKNESVKSRRKERFARRVRKMIENRILDENKAEIEGEIAEIVNKDNE